MVCSGRQPATGCMTVIASTGTLNMGGTLIICMAAGTGTGKILMICSGGQPAIRRMTVVTVICALGMVSTLIICMAIGADTGY